jgi:hypothetical protein
MAEKMAMLKIRPTKKERKTKQKQQRSKENTKTRRGKKEKQRAFPSSPAKLHKAEGRAPLRRLFRASLSKQEREA